MPYLQAVKEIAYKLDPDCWKSYSGHAILIKRARDLRRTETLRKAQELYSQLPLSWNEVSSSEWTAGDWESEYKIILVDKRYFAEHHMEGIRRACILIGASLEESQEACQQYRRIHQL